jgi:5-methyltetrahydrofolate--homocysteine methyltransferase
MGRTSMHNFKELTIAIIDGNAERAVDLTEQAVDSGISPIKVVNDAMIVGMDEVGRRFAAGEFYIPEMLIAARAMRAAMDVVKPLLSVGELGTQGTVVLGTVKGDLHDIGKNLVGMMLEGAGFTVVDLGVDVPVDKFADGIREHRADVVGMSALLTTTMMEMRTIIRCLVEVGLRDRVKVIVGGAPITRAYADEIGADAYAPDAAATVDVVRQLLNTP